MLAAPVDDTKTSRRLQQRFHKTMSNIAAVAVVLLAIACFEIPGASASSLVFGSSTPTNHYASAIVPKPTEPGAEHQTTIFSTSGDDDSSHRGVGPLLTRLLRRRSLLDHVEDEHYNFGCDLLSENDCDDFDICEWMEGDQVCVGKPDNSLGALTDVYGPVSSALHGNKLFVAAVLANTVFVVDADEESADYGEKEVFANVPAPRVPVVDVTSNRLYVSSASGYVYALSLQNGQPLARYWTGCFAKYNVAGLMGLAMRSTHPNELYTSCFCWWDCRTHFQRRILKISIDASDTDTWPDTSPSTIDTVYQLGSDNAGAIEIADNGIDIYIGLGTGDGTGKGSSRIAKGNLGSPASGLEDLPFDSGVKPRISYVSGIKLAGNGILMVSNYDNDRIHALDLSSSPLKEALTGWSFPAGTRPAGIEVSTVTNTVYVNARGGNKIYWMPCWLPFSYIKNCPETDIILTTDYGKCTAQATWAEPTASCGGTPLTVNHLPGEFPVGNTPVTYTATDESGVSSICEFAVTVSQSVWVTSCPETDIILTTDYGKCTAQATWAEPTASCGSTLERSHSPGDDFDAGETTVVTYTATDESGVSASCSFTVTVLWEATYDCEPACAAVGGLCVDNCGGNNKERKSKKGKKGNAISNCDEVCSFFNAILSPGNSKCDAARGGGKLCPAGLVCCKGCDEGNTRYPDGTLVSFQSQLSAEISANPIAMVEKALPRAFANGASKADMTNVIGQLFDPETLHEAAADLSTRVIPDLAAVAEFIDDAVTSVKSDKQDSDELVKIISGLKATMQGILQETSLAAEFATQAAADASSIKAAATEIHVGNLQGALQAKIGQIVAGLGNTMEAVTRAKDAALQAKNSARDSSNSRPAHAIEGPDVAHASHRKNRVSSP